MADSKQINENLTSIDKVKMCKGVSQPIRLETPHTPTAKNTREAKEMASTNDFGALSCVTRSIKIRIPSASVSSGTMSNRAVPTMMYLTSLESDISLCGGVALALAVGLR